MTDLTAQMQERATYDIDWFRNQVAPLRKNFWNDLDEKVLNGKFGWVFLILGLIGLSAGLLLGGENTLFSLIGVTSFFLLYLAYNLSSKFKAKPAQWVMAPLAELLSSSLYGDTIYPIREVVKKTRAEEPLAEFVVEYLFDRRERDEKRMPQNFVLWMYPVFGHGERKAVLLFQEGKIFEEPQGTEDSLY